MHKYKGWNDTGGNDATMVNTCLWGSVKAEKCEKEENVSADIYDFYMSHE